MSESNNSLYNLVHSMTGNEKRHFVIYAKRHAGEEGNVGLALFRDLEHCTLWDKKKFLGDHSHRPYIRHIRFHQHRLFREVLRSLHLFHRTGSVQEELREQLHHMQLLLGKGLFKEAQKMIRAGVQRAEEFQLTLLKYEFLKMETELAREMNFSGYSVAMLRDLHEKMRTALVQAEKEREVESKSAEIYYEVARDGLIRDKKVQQEYIRKLKGIESGGEDTFRGSFLREQSKIFLYTVSMEYEKARKHSEKVLHAFQQHPHMKGEMMRSHIITLHNHAVILNNLKEYRALPEVFRELGGIRPVSSQVKNRWFYTFYNLRLTTLNEAGEFSTAQRILMEMRRRLKRGEVKFLNRQHEQTHAFSAMICSMGNRDWKAANKYCRSIISGADPAQRSDIVYVSHLLLLFIYLESGKQEMLDHAMRTVKPYLEKRKRHYLFEEHVMDFFQYLIQKGFTSGDLTTAYSSLLERSERLSKQPQESILFELFNFIAWLQSRLSGRDFGETLRTRALKEGWDPGLAEMLLNIP